MKRLVLSIIIMSSVLFAGNGSPLKISVKKEYSNSWGVYYYAAYITSLMDGLIVKSAKINRGHCRISLTTSGGRVIRLPKTIDYGNKIAFMIPLNCDILSVETSTNQGDWSVEY